MKFVILEMSPNSCIDSRALHVLNEMLKVYKIRGVRLVLANPNLKVMEKLVASKLIEEVDQDHVFISILSIEIRSSGESLTLLPRELTEIKVTYCWIGSQECATNVVQLNIKPKNAKRKLQST
jgi:STAS domain